MGVGVGGMWPVLHINLHLKGQKVVSPGAQDSRPREQGGCPLGARMQLSESYAGVANLGLCEHQRRGHFKALGPRQVLVELELVLQLQQLLAGEGGARPTALPQQVGLCLGWGGTGAVRPASQPRPAPAPTCSQDAPPQGRRATHSGQSLCSSSCPQHPLPKGTGGWRIPWKPGPQAGGTR